MKAVVLAGGKGRRLIPYTQVIPKPLMPIGDVPILEVLLWQMKRAGIIDVILTVGHLADLLRAYFQDGGKFGLHITYSREEEPLGTAGPLALVDGLDGTFLVTNGDVLTTLPLQDLIAFHRANRAAATIAVHQRKALIDFGVVHCDGNNRIVDYTEKPSIDYLVSMGVYVFDASILPYIKKGEYLDFPDLVHRLIGSGEKVIGYPFSGYWLDIGRPDDYEQATEDFIRMRKEFLPEG